MCVAMGVKMENESYKILLHMVVRLKLNRLARQPHYARFHVPSTPSTTANISAILIISPGMKGSTPT